MKEKTIIKELFEDIEKFGWDLVKDKIHFYKNAEKLQILNAVNEGISLCDCEFDDEANEYYNDTYGEEESN